MGTKRQFDIICCSSLHAFIFDICRKHISRLCKMSEQKAESASETSKKQVSKMDFGELKNDTDFITKSNNLESVLDKIDERISSACDFPNYDDLSTEEKVKYDLFLSYSINSLYWMLCKLQAIDPNSVSNYFTVDCYMKY